MSKAPDQNVWCVEVFLTKKQFFEVEGQKFDDFRFTFKNGSSKFRQLGKMYFLGS